MSLGKGARIADIKASAKASGKTPTCTVLKQRSNSGYYGQVCYLEKQVAGNTQPKSMSIEVRTKYTFDFEK